MNASCSCKQPNKFFQLVYLIIERELEGAESLDDVQIQSKITQMVLVSLMKTVSADSFFRKMFTEISNSEIINENFFLYHNESSPSPQLNLQQSLEET